METEDRVQVLEDELKLIKSELRQTLVSVRDFLLDFKIPPMQEEINPPEQKEQSPETSAPDSSQPATNENSPAQASPEQIPYPEDSTSHDRSQYTDPEPRITPVAEGAPPQAYTKSDDAEDQRFPIEDISPEVEVSPDIEENEMTSGEIPLKNEPEMIDSNAEEMSDMRIDETKPSASQVNLLANLIRWVSRAKKEIGAEQLSIFLEVYAIGGSLSQEMKEVILHLSEVATDPEIEAKTSCRNEMIDEHIALCIEINNLSGQLPPELRDNIRRLTALILHQSVRMNKADVWSQLLLELHGILTGGGTSLRLLEPKKETQENKALDGIDETGTPENAEQPTESSLEEATPAVISGETEESSPEQKGIKPARLRLVMPQGDGSEQELDLGNLFIATDSSKKKGNGHKGVSLPEG